MILQLKRRLGGWEGSNELIKVIVYDTVLSKVCRVSIFLFSRKSEQFDFFAHTDNIGDIVVKYDYKGLYTYSLSSNQIICLHQLFGGREDKNFSYHLQLKLTKLELALK